MQTSKVKRSKKGQHLHVSFVQCHIVTFHIILILYNIIIVLAGQSSGKNYGKCSGCLAVDCGKCKNCRDNTKFGGSGRKKQKCVLKTCVNPSVSSQICPVRHLHDYVTYP